MNVQEVEARMVAQITGLEEQENRLQEWLECLRKLEGIAAAWNWESIKATAIEAIPAQIPRVFEGVAMDSELEAVKEPQDRVHEECAVKRQMAEVAFDQLRRRLARKSERKSKPVFNSGLFSGASA